MSLYYLRNGQEVGPISETELQELTNNGTLPADTLARREGEQDFRPAYEFQTATIASAPSIGTASLPSEAQTAGHFCTECGNRFPASDLMAFEDRRVCVNCKDLFTQRLRQGAPATTRFRYAGFWVRFLAYAIDSIIIGVVVMVLGSILSVGIFATRDANGNPNTAAVTGFMGLLIVGQFALIFAYYVYFWSKHGATPGKMALGLKVVTPDGGPISVGRSFGRYFGYILDSFTLMIGFIMAGFDDEKRTLHDRICNTRVIHTR